MIERREKIIKKLIFSYNISIRTVSSLKHNCSYVPNVLAFDTPQSIRSNCAKCHIFGTFGTPNTKNLIYQMFQILLFLPHMNSTLTFCHCTDSCGISFYYFFIPLSLSFLRQSHLQTLILSFQTPLCLSVSHSLFLLAPSPYSASVPRCSPRRRHLLPRSPPSEIRSCGSSRSLSSSPSSSSRPGSGTELLTSSSLARI